MYHDTCMCPVYMYTVLYTCILNFVYPDNTCQDVCIRMYNFMYPDNSSQNVLLLHEYSKKDSIAIEEINSTRPDSILPSISSSILDDIFQDFKNQFEEFEVNSSLNETQHGSGEFLTKDSFSVEPELSLDISKSMDSHSVQERHEFLDGCFDFDSSGSSDSVQDQNENKKSTESQPQITSGYEENRPIVMLNSDPVSDCMKQLLMYISTENVVEAVENAQKDCTSQSDQENNSATKKYKIIWQKNSVYKPKFQRILPKPRIFCLATDIDNKQMLPVTVDNNRGLNEI